MKYDFVIVGAGFAGSVAAENLVNMLDCKILLIDQRDHIAGNAYDYYDEHGILVHKYGPHIFHTNSSDVFDYMSKFTQWRFYEHEVLANVDQKLVPIPINLNTINSLYDLNLSEAELEMFFEKRREDVPHIKTAEDMVISQIGRDLYQKFFLYYTLKQWGVSPAELDKSVTARIPTRINCDNRYFTDTYQYMPLHGYTKVFEKMLSHPNIHIKLNTSYQEIKDNVHFDHLIYTGPIDEYFNYQFGKLPYRSLQFQHKTIDQEWVQPVGVVNYPGNDVNYTRITEYKHLTGQKHSKTSITHEYPCWDGDPFYPVPNSTNAMLYSKYKNLACSVPNITFIGRLGTYRYYNMDQVIGQSLVTSKKLANLKIMRK